MRSKFSNERKGGKGKNRITVWNWKRGRDEKMKCWREKDKNKRYRQTFKKKQKGYFIRNQNENWKGV